MGIIFGFLLVSHPEKFSGVQQTSYETMPTGVAAGEGAKIGVLLLSIVKMTSKRPPFASSSVIASFNSFNW